MANFPFTARVNSTIKYLDQPPFREGAEVTVENAMPNGQFVYVREHDRPLHIDRFDLTSAQLDLVRGLRES